MRRAPQVAQAVLRQLGDLDQTVDRERVALVRQRLVLGQGRAHLAGVPQQVRAQDAPRARTGAPAFERALDPRQRVGALAPLREEPRQTPRPRPGRRRGSRGLIGR